MRRPHAPSVGTAVLALTVALVALAVMAGSADAQCSGPVITTDCAGGWGKCQANGWCKCTIGRYEADGVQSSSVVNATCAYSSTTYGTYGWNMQRIIFLPVTIELAAASTAMLMLIRRKRLRRNLQTFSLSLIFLCP